MPNTGNPKQRSSARKRGNKDDQEAATSVVGLDLGGTTRTELAIGGNKAGEGMDGAEGRCCCGGG